MTIKQLNKFLEPYVEFVREADCICGNKGPQKNIAVTFNMNAEGIHVSSVSYCESCKKEIAYFSEEI